MFCKFDFRLWKMLTHKTRVSPEPALALPGKRAVSLLSHWADAHR